MVASGEYDVQYSTSFDERPNAWRLVELERDGAAVLCTAKRTWALRFAEDSNLMLFGEVAAAEAAPKAAPEITLRGSVTGTLECLAVQPRLRKVRKLLEEKNSYTT